MGHHRIMFLNIINLILHSRNVRCVFLSSIEGTPLAPPACHVHHTKFLVVHAEASSASASSHPPG